MIFGGGDRDILLGGDGNDGINGQGGSPDTVAGGQGIDTVIGENVDEAFSIFVDWCDDM